MGEINVTSLISHLIMFIVNLLLAVSVHEAAHAWMSYKFGDDTAYLLGRVTINPVKHTDPIGTLIFPILGFFASAFGGFGFLGWGKPTPVNPRKWTKYKLANVMVSVAGVLGNLILGIIGFTIAKILIMTHTIPAAEFLPGSHNTIGIFLNYLIFMNFSLLVFNLLPIPPLDGGKILSTFLPQSFQPILDLFENFGFILLFILIPTGILSSIFIPIRNLIYNLLIT